MRFTEMMKTPNLDGLEVKFLCELYLAKEGLNRERIVLSDLEKEDIEHRVGVISVDKVINFTVTEISNNKITEKGLRTFISEFTSRHSREDIIYAYALSDVGVKVVEDGLNRKRRASERKMSPEVVNAVHNLFVKETKNSYTCGFRNEGNATAYLTNAFNKFFYPGFIGEINKIKDPRSTEVKGDEESVSIFELIPTAQLDTKEVSYDIPNFKELVRRIYKGSLATAYGKGKPNYDLFSHYKFEILESQYTEFISRVNKHFSMSLHLCTQLEDVEAYHWFSTRNIDHSKRIYTNRKTFINYIRSLDKTQPLTSQCQAITSLGKWSGGDRSNIAIFKPGKDKLEWETTFWDIIQGIEATESLITLLYDRGIDPLSIPSDIFRDLKWLQKVDGLETYLAMHDNIKELEVEEEKLGVLMPNDAVAREIVPLNLEALKKRKLGDIKEVLNGSVCTTTVGLYEAVNPKRPYMSSTLPKLLNIQNVCQTNLTNCLKFKQVSDMLTDRSNFYNTNAKGRITDWLPVQKGTLNLIQNYNTYTQGLNVSYGDLGGCLMLTYDNIISNFGVELSDELYFDIFRGLSVFLFFTNSITDCFQRLKDYNCSTLGIVDVMNEYRNFIELQDNFVDYSRLASMRHSNILCDCFVKGTSPAVIREKMNPIVESVLEFFSKEMEILNRILKNTKSELSSVKTKDDKKLGTHEDKLMQIARVLDLTVSKPTSREALNLLVDMVKYKDAYMMNRRNGKFITKEFNGEIHYLHKTGKWIPPRLNVNLQNLRDITDNGVI